jgi:hypothetical protein
VADHEIDFAAPATLRKWPSLKNDRVPKAWGGVPYFVADGTLDKCIREFISKPPSQGFSLIYRSLFLVASQRKKLSFLFSTERKEHPTITATNQIWPGYPLYRR